MVTEIGLLEKTAVALSQTGVPIETGLATVLRARLADRGQDFLVSLDGVGVPTIITAEMSLVKAAAEYRGNRESPEALYGLMDAYWNNFRAESTRSGRNLVPSALQLSDCPFTAEDLYNLRQQSFPDMGFYLPAILADNAGIPLLRAGLPEMSIYVQDEGQISYTPRVGWVFAESGLYTPNSGTNQQQAEKIFKESGRFGQTPNIFIALSGLIKIVDGRYIDERSTSRLLGCLIQGKAAGAGFSRDGGCNVYLHWAPEGRVQRLGARSLGVKS